METSSNNEEISSFIRSMDQQISLVKHRPFYLADI